VQTDAFGERAGAVTGQIDVAARPEPEKMPRGVERLGDQKTPRPGRRKAGKLSCECFRSRACFMVRVASSIEVRVWAPPEHVKV
jgi:hypothetical protein